MYQTIHGIVLVVIASIIILETKSPLLNITSPSNIKYLYSIKAQQCLQAAGYNY